MEKELHIIKYQTDRPVNGIKEIVNSYLNDSKIEIINITYLKDGCEIMAFIEFRNRFLGIF